MREIRQSGSEGGATSTIVPTPILGTSDLILLNFQRQPKSHLQRQVSEKLSSAGFRRWTALYRQSALRQERSAQC